MFMDTIRKIISSLLKNDNKTIISGRKSTNIIGDNNNVNNGQIIEVNEATETLVVKDFGE